MVGVVVSEEVEERENVVFGISRGPSLEFVVCSSCDFDCLLNQFFEFSIFVLVNVCRSLSVISFAAPLP